MDRKQQKPGERPGETTPGKPTDSASRQQTTKDQSLQSGSPELDREATQDEDAKPVPTIPASAK